MKNLLNIKPILFLGILFTTFSCQKEYKQEFNWAYPVSGDWTVKVANGGNVLTTITMKTYNTSFGKDSIWVDDNKNFWPFKAKAKVDVKAGTFQTTDFVSYQGSKDEDNVTIGNAKVMNKDSIYMEVSFGSEPGKTYTISGHRKQSYEEYMGL